MDKTEEYANQLVRLKAETTDIIDGIKDSETLLENAMNSACEQIRRAYISEAKKLLDAMTQRRLEQVEREESRLGPTLVKDAIGIIGTILAKKAEKSELARELAQDAFEGYQMDDVKKVKIKEASDRAKRRFEEQALSLRRDELMKSLRGGRALRKSLTSIFREELTEHARPVVS